MTRLRKLLGSDSGDKAKVGLGSSFISFSFLFHGQMVAPLHDAFMAGSWQFSDTESGLKVGRRMPIKPDRNCILLTTQPGQSDSV
jgi:hypothetical protein